MPLPLSGPRKISFIDCFGVPSNKRGPSARTKEGSPAPFETPMANRCEPKLIGTGVPSLYLSPGTSPTGFTNKSVELSFFSLSVLSALSISFSLSTNKLRSAKSCSTTSFSTPSRLANSTSKLRIDEPEVFDTTLIPRFSASNLPIFSTPLFSG